jgi:hypothetical protein
LFVTVFRRALAFLVAPLFVTALWVALAVISGGDAGGVALLVSAITLTHSIALGVPIALAMARLGLLTLRNTALASFLIGAIPLPALLYFDSWTISFIENTLPTALIFGTSGLVAGLIWWPIWQVPSGGRTKGDVAA